MFDALFYSFEALRSLVVVVQLRDLIHAGEHAVAWPWIALVIGLNAAGDADLYLHQHDAKWVFWVASLALYLLLRVFGGRGLGRKLGRKLLSAALTSVNAAAFRRQVSEAS